MNRKLLEIHQGKEVFENGKFAKFPTLRTIISNKENELSDLMSVRVAAHGTDYIEQYNIETQNFITNFTHHNGLDLLLTQYNKETKTRVVYTPYSNPGYDVFVNLLLGYYEKNHKRPKIDFSNVNVEKRNKAEKSWDLPLKDFIDSIRWDMAIYLYLEQKDLYKEDSTWTFRPLLPKDTEEDKREGIGFKDNTTIMNISSKGIGNNSSHTISTFVFENEIIPVYLQAFIDTNLSVAGNTNLGNLQKIYEMIYYTLEHPEIDKDKVSRRAWIDTPLTQK